MEDVKIMESLEAKGDLDERLPDGALLKLSGGLLMGNDLLVEVAVIEKLHDDAAWWGSYQRELASMKECL
jgi:hypothetical protein